MNSQYTELLQSLITMVKDVNSENTRNDIIAIRARGRVVIPRIFRGKDDLHLMNFERELDNWEEYETSPKLPVQVLYQRKRYWRDRQRRVLTNISTMLEEVNLESAVGEEKTDISNSLTTKARSKRKKLKISDVSRKMFLVHGHDETMKQSVARVVERLGLDPIILHEQPNRGRTIIEKFTDHSNVGFAIILLSPDDLGYENHIMPIIPRPRARQNVILEMGFFLGKLGRERVFVLYPENVGLELPSDYSGVLYTKYDAAGHWQLELVQELRAAGYDVDANKLVRGN